MPQKQHKKIIFFLLTLVLIVWGIIFYRILSRSSLPTISVAPNITLKEENRNQFLKDTFHIKANYRDPFLGKLVFSDQCINLKPRPIRKQPTAKPSIGTTSWPSISYGGLIKNQKSNKQLILIMINGENGLMKLGDQINGIELKKVYKDSIEVSMDRLSMIIRK